MAKDLKANAARYAAVESVKFFKDSFVKQGFADTSFVPWKKANNPLMSKRTLYNKGVLMQSVRVKKQNLSTVVVESATSYSEIHNNGGYIIVTRQMQKFWWAKYYQFIGKIRTSKGGTVTSLSKTNRATSAKAMFCKRMAMKKVGSKIKIDQRQFMGNSKTMMDQFHAWYNGQVEVVFKDNSVK